MEEIALSGVPASVSTAFREADPAARATILGEMANHQAAAIYDTRRAEPGWRTQPPRRVGSLARAVLFVMAKDEADIIGQNLAHHHALGFRRFFVLDNASTDGTADVIAAFRAAHGDASVFYAYDFVTGHYQAAKMKALDAFMQSYLHYEDTQPEWLFFVDADEFITCGSVEHERSIESFNRILNDASKNLLVFHWVQCSSAEVIRSLPDRHDLFEAFPHSWPRMRAQVPKIAYRIGRGLSPIQGNHSVTAFPYDLSTVAVMAEVDFYLFHFPNRTVDQLRKKVVNANTALSATKDRDGLSGTASHWRVYYGWYREHGDAALERILAEHISGCTGG